MFIILLVISLSPLVIPWCKKSLIYCLTVWLLLWVVFFFQMEREINPIYDVGLISDGVIIACAICIFIVAVALRSLAQYIWFKFNIKRMI